MSEKSEDRTPDPTKKRVRLSKLDLPTLLNVLEGRLIGKTICFSNAWGGLEQIAAEDYIDIRKLGINMTMVCLKGSPIHEHLKENPLAQLEVIEFKPKDLFDQKLKKLIQRWILTEGITLIHVHQSSLLGSFVPAMWKYPHVVLVLTRHIMNSHNKKNIFHKMIYRRVDSLIVFSQALRENIMATHTLKERQVDLIHYGLNFERFDSKKSDRKTLREEWGVDDKTLLVGLVGRIDPAKGQESFIKAAAGLLKSGPQEKLKFILVGEPTAGQGTDFLDRLKKIVEQFKIQDSVIFGGFREDIPSVMGALDILAMPSREEAFGLVAIEAMAMGCPVVISNAGSAQEIVGQEEYGLLVRPEDAFDLQRKLKKLINFPKDRMKMAKLGQSHVKKYFDRKIRIQKTLALYERAMRRRGL